MSEPQYQDYFNHPRETMGVMASQYWRDDPKLLGIHLARYKFVAKMLAGKAYVAEVGCGDGWFSRIVERAVGKLWLFDFDHKLIADNIERGGSSLFHDSLDGPIPNRPYDAIYSLDVFEHIAPDKTNIYLSNIKQSLTDSGVFICGIPSLESQEHANEASKVGHVNCLSGDTFKGLLQAHFSNVFVLSMNDEVIHTGFYPMAHYLMAICTC